MDNKELDKSLQKIVAMKNKLHALGYDHEQYDSLEEDMHQLEDDFQKKYGEHVERILQQVHDEYCPDTEVLYSVSYIAKSYKIDKKKQYKVDFSEGVYVDIDEFSKEDTRLAILPNPTRIILNIGKKEQRVVWPKTLAEKSI